MSRPVRDWTERLWRQLVASSSTSLITGDVAIVQVSDDRRRVRDGTLFTASNRRQLASNATDVILLRVNGNPTAMRLQITAELELDVEILEGATVDVPTDATDIPLYARNRITGVANEALLATEVIDGVTLSDFETKLLDVYVPAGRKNAGVGGSGNSDLPFALKTNTDYAIRIQNLQNATNEISFILTITEQVA